jgi:small-conductance mechanosensitive channel
MVLDRISPTRTRILAVALVAATTFSLTARPQEAQETTAPATVTPAQAATTPAPAAKAATTPSRSSALAQTLPQQIAALPALDGTGIDSVARGKEVLTHLNAVLRFYRDSLSDTQKIGEPSDVLYSGQATLQATQIAQRAFQAARNMAALFSKINSKTPAVTATSDDDDDGQPAPQTQAQRLAQVRATALAKLANLQAQDTALDAQISKAKAKDLPALRLQDEQVEGQLELQKAILDALGKMSTMADTKSPGVGLAGDIDRLQRTAPELSSTTAKPAAPPLLENLGSVHDAGVSTQAVALFQLFDTRRAIDDRIAAIDLLSQQANSMRKPMVGLLQTTLKQGDAAMQAAPDPHATDADTLNATRKHYDSLTNTFRVLSTATMPLSEELVLLEQARANLQSWRGVVDAEYTSVLHGLLLRVAFIALALLVLFVVSQVWQHMTVKYVQDIRRRRTILITRRIVTGFFTGIVLIFGFVTQFSSLATFAGFITAGIAVGLQTILLSVAAYFFIVGRYGVRVGDRITVAGVTGDVVEVGLVRFYMMELTGTGTGAGLHPTGRIAVFANSVLFQAGTPLYKQVPGTEYGWHELTVRLNPDTDYQAATKLILASVQGIYEGYRMRIEGQHKMVEAWMETALETPHVEPRLQLAETGLQYTVLFPVETRDAATTDEQIVRKLLADVAENEAVKKAIVSPPTVKAVIKA